MSKFDILDLYKERKTVFTMDELALMFDKVSPVNLKSRVNYYVSRGKLISPRKGIYVKSKDYDAFELATKIYSPAYISLETVLQKEGVIFQHYQTIFIASYLSRDLAVDGKKFSYKKIKDDVLHDPMGLVNMGEYFVASRERAFLDTLYLFKNYHFDNLQSMDWEKCFEIAQIYRSRVLVKRLKRYYVENK